MTCITNNGFTDTSFDSLEKFNHFVSHLKNDQIYKPTFKHEALEVISWILGKKDNDNYINQRQGVIYSAVYSDNFTGNGGIVTFTTTTNSPQRFFKIFSNPFKNRHEKNHFNESICKDLSKIIFIDNFLNDPHGQLSDCIFDNLWESIHKLFICYKPFATWTDIPRIISTWKENYKRNVINVTYLETVDQFNALLCSLTENEIYKIIPTKNNNEMLDCILKNHKKIERPHGLIIGLEITSSFRMHQDDEPHMVVSPHSSGDVLFYYSRNSHEDEDVEITDLISDLKNMKYFEEFEKISNLFKNCPQLPESPTDERFFVVYKPFESVQQPPEPKYIPKNDWRDLTLKNSIHENGIGLTHSTRYATNLRTINDFNKIITTLKPFEVLNINMKQKEQLLINQLKDWLFGDIEMAKFVNKRPGLILSITYGIGETFKLLASPSRRNGFWELPVAQDCNGCSTCMQLRTLTEIGCTQMFKKLSKWYAQLLSKDCLQTITEFFVTLIPVGLNVWEEWKETVSDECKIWCSENTCKPWCSAKLYKTWSSHDYIKNFNISNIRQFNTLVKEMKENEIFRVGLLQEGSAHTILLKYLKNDKNFTKYVNRRPGLIMFFSYNDGTRLRHVYLSPFHCKSSGNWIITTHENFNDHYSSEVEKTFKFIKNIQFFEQSASLSKKLNIDDVKIIDIHMTLKPYKPNTWLEWSENETIETDNTEKVKEELLTIPQINDYWNWYFDKEPLKNDPEPQPCAIS